MQPITLSPAEITSALAEDSTRGILPKIVKTFATSGEMYVDVFASNPALAAKYGTEDNGLGALRNALKQAVKNAHDKAVLGGGTFPELSVARVSLDDGETETVILVNDAALARAESNGA